MGILKKRMGIIQIDGGDTWEQDGKAREGMLVRYPQVKTMVNYFQVEDKKKVKEDTDV